MAHPVQIVVAGDSEKDNFVLREESLASIIAKIPNDAKVSIVSVVGAFKTGKSFLLNFFLRYLRNGHEGDESSSWMVSEGDALTEGNMNEGAWNLVEPEIAKFPSTGGARLQAGKKAGFAWRGGQERQTKGIWMWSEPFIRTTKASGGEKLAILLMDTQGMFDNETTMMLTDMRIFGLSTLVSSFQIYNVDKRIHEDNLQHLALFSEYGRIASQKRTDPLIPAPPFSGMKPFQRLQFIVRDWQNFETDYEEGQDASVLDALHAGMQQYLTDVLRTRGVSDLQSTRDAIERCFGKLDCYMLPHPGFVVTRKNYDGAISRLDPFCRAMLNKYVRNLFETEMEAKVINGHKLSGRELQTYFEVYVEMFQADQTSFPSAKTVLAATNKATNRNGFDLFRTRFQSPKDAEEGAQGYIVANCPYLRANGLYRYQDGRFKHTGLADAWLLIFGNSWSISIDGKTVCQAPGLIGGEPPSEGWEYWEARKGIYISANNMKITRIHPLAATNASAMSPPTTADNSLDPVLPNTDEEWALDPVLPMPQPEDEDDSALDPVLPPSPRTACGITQPPDSPDRNSALLIDCDGGEEADSSLDPVKPSAAHSPHATGENTQPPVPPDESSALLQECDTVMRLASGVPVFADWLQRKAALLTQLATAKSAEVKDYATIAKIGTEMQRLQEEGAGLTISEEEFCALPVRHRAVVQAVEARCEVLEGQEKYVELQVLAGKLTLLEDLDMTPTAKAADLAATSENSAGGGAKKVVDLPDISALRRRMVDLLEHVRAAPHRKKWLEDRDALQAQYQAAKDAVPKKWALVAQLGIELTALKEESAKLALSEEDYVTLLTRRERLVLDLERACEELVATEQYAMLAEVTALLGQIRAVDLAAL